MGTPTAPVSAPSNQHFGIMYDVNIRIGAYHSGKFADYLPVANATRSYPINGISALEVALLAARCFKQFAIFVD